MVRNNRYRNEKEWYLKVEIYICYVFDRFKKFFVQEKVVIRQVSWRQGGYVKQDFGKFFEMYMYSNQRYIDF